MIYSTYRSWFPRASPLELLKWMKVLSCFIVTLSFCVCMSYGLKAQQVFNKTTEAIDKRAPHERQQMRFVTVKNGQFIDPVGREIILHGVNIVDKSSEHNYLSWHGPKEFAKMREWGFNCIRLGIIWDGLEPEPGLYDDEYLAGVDKRIQWAKENGIYVLLDMHQDLFNARFGGDGAPDWATLDNGKPHIHTGSVWSMAYFTSPAVQAAFDNFWNNKPASDGLGIQDHFAQVWQYVANRYANEPTVIGYDIFNEPFPGSTILQTITSKIEALAEVFARKQKKSPSTAEIMQNLMHPDMLKSYADDIDIYKAFVDGGVSITQEFERTVLASFYNRVAKAIRQVDQNHIIFMETHIICNGGTPSGIVPILDQNGDRDMLQAFAPHGYDIVTDTDMVADASAKRVELIFDRHVETGKRLETPVLIGEWGAFCGRSGTLPAAQMIVDQLEKHRFSDTYWSYGSSREMEDAPYFHVLARPYPAVISGALIRCRSSLRDGSFSCTWKENPAINASSRIYLPAYWFAKGYTVALEPEADNWSFEPVASDSHSGYLVIPPTGQEVERSLTVRVNTFPEK